MARRKQTKGRKFNDEELAAHINGQLANALGGDDSSELSNQRSKAMEYYLGEPYGNEMEGQSTVRTREVMDTIEWIKPELMKIFASGQETVRFEPEGPNDVEAAQQATDYVNYIFDRKNQGFKVLYQWITDGLLQKNGIVKVWWDDTRQQVREDYQGLNELEYQMLVADPDVEIIEADSVEEMIEGPEGPIQMAVYDVAIKRAGAEGGIKIDVIPPEEFLIAKGSKDIQDAAFCAHRCKKTISDLNEAGYDTRELEAYYTELALSDEKQARHALDDTDDEDYDEGSDPTMRRVLYEEVYIRMDYDRDGIAEIRKVCKVGNTILANEEVDCMPFAGWTPIIISHKFHGLSMADLVMDLQLIQSQLLRNILNNQYLTNNGRYAVLDGMANIDDLLTSRAHGVVRMKVPGAVTRIDTPQLGASAFQMLEYMDKLREKRTGVSERQQGIDQNSLASNQAASAVNQIMTAAQQRIELIARVFAETGMTDLFRLIYKMVIQKDTQKSIFKLRDKYVEINPSEWRDRVDTSVVVGLGNGSKESEMQQLGMVFQNVMAISQHPGFSTIASKKKTYNLLEDMVKVFNKASAGRYFQDPDSDEAKKAQEEAKAAEAQQQKQAMEMQKMQLQIEDRKVKVAELQAQTAKMKAEMEMQLKGREVDVKEGALQQDKVEHEDNIALSTAELELEYEIEKEQGRGVSLGD